MSRLASKSVSVMSLRLIERGCVVGFSTNERAHASVRQSSGEEALVITNYISYVRPRTTFLLCAII